MSTRECDHCDDAVADLMSLVDHEFTGDEVRALNKHMAGVEAKHAVELAAVTSERDELRAQLHRLMGDE